MMTTEPAAALMPRCVTGLSGAHRRVGQVNRDVSSRLDFQLKGLDLTVRKRQLVLVIHTILQHQAPSTVAELRSTAPR